MPMHSFCQALRHEAPRQRGLSHNVHNVDSSRILYIRKRNTESEGVAQQTLLVTYFEKQTCARTRSKQTCAQTRTNNQAKNRRVRSTKHAPMENKRGIQMSS